MTDILQIRGVPADVVAGIKARAARRNMSVSSYIRDLLARDVAQEPMEDALARISQREPVLIDDNDIVSAIHEGRR